MAPYAEQTDVPVERSMNEIRKLVAAHGATKFGSMEDAGCAAVAFTLGNRNIRMVLHLPELGTLRFQREPAGKQRSPAQAHVFWERGCRAAWRALLLSIKAKFVTIESGISTVETEFLPFIVIPNSQTVGEWLRPQLETAYKQGICPNPIAGLLEPPKATAQVLDVAAEQ